MIAKPQRLHAPRYRKFPAALCYAPQPQLTITYDEPVVRECRMLERSEIRIRKGAVIGAYVWVLLTRDRQAERIVIQVVFAQVVQPPARRRYLWRQTEADDDEDGSHGANYADFLLTRLA